MKIAYLTLATGKYNIFIEGLVNSGNQNFLTEDNVDFIIFTDDKNETLKKLKKTKIIYQEKLGFPYDTLKRYHIINKNIEMLKSYDYIFYGNVNMIFNKVISNKILPDETQNNLVAVAHPGYYNTKNTEYPYERNPISTAYVKYGEENNMYYQGCFYGGKTENFLKMSEEIENNINEDLKNNIIAIWWDESHTNKYFIKYPPKALAPSYAFPEIYPNLPFDKKIIQLDKNNHGGHSFLRE